MVISIIVAAGINNEIGKENDLLWHLPADMKHFKEITTGHVIIMGRKTFESLPKGALPNRTNVVLSRDKNYSPENCLVFSSIDKVLVRFSREKEIFIIGGGEIYRQAFLLADKIYLTKVHAGFEDAEVFFPKISLTEWKEISREFCLRDEKNKYDYTFYEYERV